MRRAVRELNLIARLASRSTKIMPADTSPSPPLRGEREGPDPQGWEGEVGGATNRLVGLPHPTLSPRPAGERVKDASSDHASAANLRTAGPYTFPEQPRTAGEGGPSPQGLAGEGSANGSPSTNSSFPIVERVASAVSGRRMG